MFIVTLLIIARTWKQPRCPLTDGWVKKLWYIYTMGYCSLLVTQSCLTLCDLVEGCPPGSFVYGILQARILE